MFHISNRNFEELALLPNGTVNELYRPLTLSMYHLHVHRWLEVFPREQILIVNGDQLIEDPISQVRRIESFLGECERCKLNVHRCRYETIFMFFFSCVCVNECADLIEILFLQFPL